MPFVDFDKRNLRRGEEILFTFKPDKRSYQIRNIFAGGGIPFPVVLLWAVVDFGIMIGVPLGTGELWILAILIPFMAVHGMPIWMYIYGVVNGVKNYRVCGHIITSARIITRKSRKAPFDEYEIANVSSITIISSKPRSSSIHIVPENDKKALTLYSLHKADADRAVNIFYDIKEREKHKEINSLYQIKCNSCGGRTDQGYCLYCGSRAELLREDITGISRVTASRRRVIDN